MLAPETPEQLGHGSASAPALAFTKVAKTYTSTAGDVTALQDITFSVQEGELVSIVGQSQRRCRVDPAVRPVPIVTACGRRVTGYT